MRILLTGASGQLGAYLISRLLETGHEPIAWSGTEAGFRGDIPLTSIDLTDPDLTNRSLDIADPEVIVHLAALSAAEAVRLDPTRARAINVEATRTIAGWCARRARRLVFTSTDLVFDGSRAWNRETDPAEPILAYGRTKREAEPAVLEIAQGVVARVCLLYGPTCCGRPYFFDRAMASIRKGEQQTFFEDEFRTPLDLATAAEILSRLAESDVSGVFHVAGPERMSRFDLMRRSATALGLDPDLVRSNRRTDLQLPEPRPADVSLDTSKLAIAFPNLRRPTIEEALRSASGV